MPKIGDAYVQIHAGAEGISNEVEKALGGAGDSAGKSAGNKFISGVGSALKIGGAAIATASSAVFAGVTKVTKDAVAAYAEFEQLQGGAELMFGDGYDYIAEQAANAYKTVQMSQNEYLTQVNGFAVGLREALGGNEQEAAKLADRIVTAEADVVAATGNTAENVQNAFNGVMKGNYTMLDNLGLGITATKEGMQEVIDKMNEVNGTEYSMDSLADIQNALIDYVEYAGMAGYATNEAADTIQGSLAMTKGAWENLLVGLADENADIEQLVQNLMTSLFGENGSGGLVGNIIPIVEQVINTLVDNLPAMLDQLMPVLANLIEKIVSFIIEHLPDILACGVQIVVAIATGIAKSVSKVAAPAIEVVKNAAKAVKDKVDSMVAAGKELVTGIFKGIKEKTDWIKNKIKDWVGNVTDFVKGIFKIGSPSKLWADEIGQWLPAGAAEGVLNNADSLYGAVDRISNNANKRFNIGATINGTASRMRVATSNGNVTDLSGVLSQISTLGDRIERMQVVMNTGQLVGAIATPMDNALGMRQTLKARGV